MMNEKVAFDVAKNEVESWLDAKAISQKRREDLTDAVDALIDGVMYGRLTFDDEQNILQTLCFPVEDAKGVELLKELKFPLRLKTNAVNSKVKGLNATDANSRIMAYASALTNVSPGILGQLDTTDMSLSQSVVAFFF